jgi:hypothetical protein
MLRFAIRDLLWLMVVVALGVGWWINRNQLTSERIERIVAERKWEETLSSARQDADRWKRIAEDLAGMMRDTGWHVELKGQGWTVAKPRKPLSDSMPMPDP